VKPSSPTITGPVNMLGPKLIDAPEGPASDETATGAPIASVAPEAEKSGEEGTKSPVSVAPSGGSSDSV
jgi:hypothetical protein